MNKLYEEQDILKSQIGWAVYNAIKNSADWGGWWHKKYANDAIYDEK